MDAHRTDLEALLVALDADPGLDRLLRVDPASVLAMFDLTAEELVALDHHLRRDDGPRLDELFTTDDQPHLPEEI